MRIACIVFIAILLSTTTVTAQPEAGYHPCRDSLYSALKSRDINSLTDREYAYLMQRERACLDYLGQESGPRTSTGREEASPPVCSLVVRLTVAAVPEGLEPIALYVDDVSFGEMERFRVLTSFEPGHHSVGLYPASMVAALRAKAGAMHTQSMVSKADGKGLAGAFELIETEKLSRRADQLNSAIVKVRLLPGKSTTVHFRLDCNTGRNDRCDDDEWFFTTTVSNPQ